MGMPLQPPIPKKPASTEGRGSSIVVTAVLLSFLVGGIAGGIVGGFSGGLISKYVRGFSSGTDAGNQQQLQQNLVVQEDSATIDVVNAVTPGVGSVIATKDVPTGTTSPFDLFFPPTGPATNTEQREVSAGTGFIISSDGLILTNKHVVEDTEADYRFITNDDTTYAATVLGRDPFNDLAILKIEANDLPVVKLGDSSGLQLGETVIAIGNTFSRYRNTITKGIISGIGRTIEAGNGNGQSETLDEVIQTDAAINPGNSGGPLIDLAGNVIGINTAVASGENIGFAIPINAAKPIIKSAIDEGKVVRPFLGIRYVAVTPAVQASNNLPVDYGAYIAAGTAQAPAISPDSAAAKAGLQEGDIILEIDGQRIDEDHTLTQIMRNHEPGDVVSLKVRRGDDELTLSATLGAFEGN